MASDQAAPPADEAEAEQSSLLSLVGGLLRLLGLKEVVVTLLGLLLLAADPEVVFEVAVVVVVEDSDTIGVDEALPDSCSCELVFCELGGHCAFCRFSDT